MTQVEREDKKIEVEIPMFTWRGAVSIYVEVLKNPKAGERAKYSATKDLLRLAGIVDDMNREKGAE